MGKNYSVYLSGKYEDYIEKYTDGLPEYVRDKIDDDLLKFPTEEKCDKQIKIWKEKKKTATKLKKKSGNK